MCYNIISINLLIYKNKFLSIRADILIISLALIVDLIIKIMTQYFTSSYSASLNSTICKLKSPTLDIRKDIQALYPRTEKQPYSARKYTPFIDPVDISRRANDIFETSKKANPNRRMLSKGHLRHYSQTSSQGGMVSKLNKFIQNEDDEADEINCANVYNYEKELFGSYNFPHDFDSAIDIISKAKEWTSDPKKYVEENINESREENKEGKTDEKWLNIVNESEFNTQRCYNKDETQVRRFLFAFNDLVDSWYAFSVK